MKIRPVGPVRPTDAPTRPAAIRLREKRTPRPEAADDPQPSAERPQSGPPPTQEARTSLLKRFAAAWRFLTVFPFFWAPGDDEGECLKRSAAMFPVVGLILGGVAAAAAWGLGWLFPPLPAAALVTALLALFSVGLHLDGLSDCGDALMTPGRSRDDALAIMKDSRIGSHGALALVLVLLVKFSALPSAPSLVWAAFAVPVGGRAALLFPLALLPYVRKQGLGTLFAAGKVSLAFGVVVTAAVLFLAMGMGWRFLPGFAVWLAVGLGWTWFLRKRLGGSTGDGYGAACELGEAAMALAMCI